MYLPKNVNSIVTHTPMDGFLTVKHNMLERTDLVIVRSKVDQQRYKIGAATVVSVTNLKKMDLSKSKFNRIILDLTLPGTETEMVEALKDACKGRTVSFFRPLSTTRDLCAACAILEFSRSRKLREIKFTMFMYRRHINGYR